MTLAVAMARRLSLRAPGIPVAVAGIALSVCIMLVSIAIVSGFKLQIKDKVTGFEHQISIYPLDEYNEGSGIALTPSLRSVIDSVAGTPLIDLGLRQPAIFKTDTDFEGIVLKGTGESGNPFIASQITEGDMPDFSGNAEGNPVVISAATANALGLKPKDRLMAHFFIGDNLYSRRVTVAAIYDTHFSEYDKLYAFAPIAMLQKLCGVDSLTGSSITIDGIAPDNIETVAENLRLKLCDRHLDGDGIVPACRVESVATAGALYFNWLALLDTNVAVILILMGCVAGFTLISCLFIIVLERVRMIGMLKALGATDTLIRRLFIYMATRLVARGLIIGNVVALLFLGAQYLWHIIPLDPEAYYLNYVPVNVDWATVAILDACVIAISLLLLVLPSHIISTLSPAETMRYE